jgi:hypothetical protein
MFGLTEGVRYHVIREDEKNVEDVPNVAATEQGSQKSLRRILILVTVAGAALLLAAFFAVGAALAHGSGESCSGRESDSAALSRIKSSLDTKAPSAVAVLPRYDSCGHNATEARSRGCRFGVMAFAWLTTECYDEALEDEFISWANWTWYTSADATNDSQISFAQARLGEQDMFVDWNYHVVHCTFMWRQQHAGLERGWIGKHLVSYHHTKHCQRTLLKDVWENRNVRTAANVMYPHCLRVGMDHHAYPGMRVAA